jgi:ABC-type cobalt transport system substrate-binding protein
MKFGVQNSELSFKRERRRLSLFLFTVFCLLLTCFLLFTVHCSLSTVASAAEWGGVDESVVEKYAGEHGREAREPLINTDQGDLLLFVFLLAGTVGGFIGGYYWRTLMEKRPESPERVQQTNGELKT